MFAELAKEVVQDVSHSPGVAGGAVLFVTAAGLLGGVAAKDASVPGVTMEARAGCPPGEIDCFETGLVPAQPESVLGEWVPEGWVGMGGQAGIAASALAFGVVLAVVVLITLYRVATGKSEHAT